MKKDIVAQTLTGKFLEVGGNFSFSYLMKLELEPWEEISQAII